MLFPAVRRFARGVALVILGTAGLALVVPTTANAFFFCFSFGGGSNGPRWGGGRPPMGWQPPPFARGPMAPGPYAGYPPPPPAAYPWAAGAYGWPGYTAIAPRPYQTPIPGAAPWPGHAAAR